MTNYDFDGAIAELPEKRVLEGWVNVYENGTFGMVSSRDYCDQYRQNRIACVPLPPIEYEVGEGL